MLTTPDDWTDDFDAPEAVLSLAYSLRLLNDAIAVFVGPKVVAYEVAGDTWWQASGRGFVLSRRSEAEVRAEWAALVAHADAARLDMQRVAFALSRR